MHFEFLIVGQGISGTWLSYFLKKEGRSFLVIDNNDGKASSRIAAGLINPVTGRRHVEVWMASEILPFALNAYREIGKALGKSVITEKTLIDFFPTPQMRQSFMQRVEEKAVYLSELSDTGSYNGNFNFDFGAGSVKPVYTVHLETLLPAWRTRLIKDHSILSEDFEINELKVGIDGIHYKDFSASLIIFCDGHRSAYNPFFRDLPFAPNKGEAIIARINDLPSVAVYKKGMVLVPLAEENMWWIGSDYQWTFEHELPTIGFRQKTEKFLAEWLKMPFDIISHSAGIRPATLERRPFVGLHPSFPRVGILNGMGTKGCSLAPFFANQLCGQLCHSETILPEANITRFRNLLSRNI